MYARDTYIASYVWFQCLTTVNNESLEWLKFGKFGKLIRFAKLSSANLFETTRCFSGEFAKLLSTKMFKNLIRQTLITPNFRCLQYWPLVAAYLYFLVW